MVEASQFYSNLKELAAALSQAKKILITAPGTADGDSIGAQLALRRMIVQSYPHLDIHIINDEEIPPRYQFLPDAKQAKRPEQYPNFNNLHFDVAIIVDGGVDRAGRVKAIFEKSSVTVFIDHHSVSAVFPYKIKLVEPTASSTTELIYYLSQTEFFKTKLDPDFCQQIYLGLIFDTGFFRHSNTTPEAMELGAKLLRSGFDFTRVGERGMLERTFSSLQLLSNTIARSKLAFNGKIIWSTLSQKDLKDFNAREDDREGIIDQLFLTQGIEVALLFFELPSLQTKISLRSQGTLNVAQFARELTVRGGGHSKAAGANLEMGLEHSVPFVLSRLELAVQKVGT